MNADGSRERRLTATSGGYYVEWSPGGRTIAFDGKVAGDREIFVVGTDRRGRKNLTRAKGEDSDPTWSPDGRKIAYRHVQSRRGHIYVMGAGGQGQMDLTDRGNDAEPAWSPDGRKIAYVHREKLTTDPYHVMRIYVMDANGAGKRALIREGRWSLFCPAWSPATR